MLSMPGPYLGKAHLKDLNLSGVDNGSIDKIYLANVVDENFYKFYLSAGQEVSISVEKYPPNSVE